MVTQPSLNYRDLKGSAEKLGVGQSESDPAKQPTQSITITQPKQVPTISGGTSKPKTSQPKQSEQLADTAKQLEQIDPKLSLAYQQASKTAAAAEQQGGGGTLVDANDKPVLQVSPALREKIEREQVLQQMSSQQRQDPQYRSPAQERYARPEYQSSGFFAPTRVNSTPGTTISGGPTPKVDFSGYDPTKQTPMASQAPNQSESVTMQPTFKTSVKELPRMFDTSPSRLQVVEPKTGYEGFMERASNALNALETKAIRQNQLAARDVFGVGGSVVETVKTKEAAKSTAKNIGIMVGAGVVGAGLTAGLGPVGTAIGVAGVGATLPSAVKTVRRDVASSVGPVQKRDVIVKSVVEVGAAGIVTKGLFSGIPKAKAKIAEVKFNRRIAQFEKANTAPLEWNPEYVVRKGTPTTDIVRMRTAMDPVRSEIIAKDLGGSTRTGYKVRPMEVQTQLIPKQVTPRIVQKIPAPLKPTPSTIRPIEGTQLLSSKEPIIVGRGDKLLVTTPEAFTKAYTRRQTGITEYLGKYSPLPRIPEYAVITRKVPTTKQTKLIDPLTGRTQFRGEKGRFPKLIDTTEYFRVSNLPRESKTQTFERFIKPLRGKRAQNLLFEFETIKSSRPKFTSRFEPSVKSPEPVLSLESQLKISPRFKPLPGLFFKSAQTPILSTRSSALPMSRAAPKLSPTQIIDPLSGVKLRVDPLSAVKPKLRVVQRQQPIPEQRTNPVVLLRTPTTTTPRYNYFEEPPLPKPPNISGIPKPPFLPDGVMSPKPKQKGSTKRSGTYAPSLLGMFLPELESPKNLGKQFFSGVDIRPRYVNRKRRR